MIHAISGLMQLTARISSRCSIITVDGHAKFDCDSYGDLAHFPRRCEKSANLGDSASIFTIALKDGESPPTSH